MTKRVTLRPVTPRDLPIFFAQQAEPEANRIAAFPARAQKAFSAHWTKILNDDTVIIKTILCAGRVAGHIVSWEQGGAREVGYWIGRSYWGQGIASAALSQFLEIVTVRPLHAHVARHNIASQRVLQKCGFVITGEGAFRDADGEQGEEFLLTLGAHD